MKTRASGNFDGAWFESRAAITCVAPVEMKDGAGGGALTSASVSPLAAGTCVASVSMRAGAGMAASVAPGACIAPGSEVRTGPIGRVLTAVELFKEAAATGECVAPVKLVMDGASSRALSRVGLSVSGDAKLWRRPGSAAVSSPAVGGGP